MAEQYIGGDQIKKIDKEYRKSELDNNIYKVEFEDGTTRELHEEIFDKAITDKQSDLSSLREKTTEVMMERIIALLLEYEIQVEDISYIFERIVNSLNCSIDDVNTKLWGKDRYRVTVKDIDKFLKDGKE